MPLKRAHAKWILAAVLCAVALFLVWDRLDREAFAEWVDLLPGWAAFLLMAVLPIFGGSVGLMYLLAGIRFGAAAGAAWMGAAIAIHLIVSFWITRSWLKGIIASRLERRGHRLPQVPPGEEGSLTLLGALIPGLPYAARNYLLALSGVPFRTYFWICFPIYFLRSLAAVYLGAYSLEMNWSRLGGVAALFLIKVAVCLYLAWRIKRRLSRMKAAAASPSC